MTPATSRHEEDLALHRAAIARTDGEIVSLIARRHALAQRVGETKRAHGLPLCDPAREAEVLRAVTAAARDAGLDTEVLRDVFWCIIGLCRTAQIHAAEE